MVVAITQGAAADMKRWHTVAKLLIEQLKA